MSLILITSFISINPFKQRIIILISTQKSKKSSNYFKFRRIIKYFFIMKNIPENPFIQIIGSEKFKERKYFFFVFISMELIISSPDQVYFVKYSYYISCRRKL